MKSKGFSWALALAACALSERPPVAAVPITSEAPIIDTRTSTTATNFDAQLFERLPTGGRNPSQLLLLVPQAVGGQPVERVTMGFTKTLIDGVDVTSLPPGWTSQPGKGGFTFSGPALDRPIGIGCEIEEVSVVRAKGITAQYGTSASAGMVSVVLKPQLLRPARLLRDPVEAIRLPRALSPGDRIRFRPLDPKFTPGGGEWKIGPWKPTWNGSFDRPLYQFDLPKDFKIDPSFQLKISYTSPWNEKLVDGTANDVVFRDAPPMTSDKPAVSGCSPAVLDSGGFCVCGSFPADAASELRINGAPVGEYLAASSPTILEYSFPPEFPAGAMEIGAGASSGFDIADGARGVLIRVRGEIDRNRLKRGQSTSLKLSLEGTDRPIDLRLSNSTPGIISLEGGNDQTVTTSGGTPNQVSRTVFAVSPGDFALHYQLTVDTCPCAGIAESSSPGESIPELGDAGAAGLAKGEQSKGGECTLEREPRNENKETWFRCIKGASDTCSKSCELWRAAKSDGSDPEKVGDQDVWKQGYPRSSRYYCLCK